MGSQGEVRWTLHVEASCRNRRAGPSMETLSCCITAYFGKIYTQTGAVDDPAKFQTQIRFALRSGDIVKGGACTFKNGTLELQDGLNLTCGVHTENLLRELETTTGRVCMCKRVQSKVWGRALTSRLTRSARLSETPARGCDGVRGELEGRWKTAIDGDLGVGNDGIERRRELCDGERRIGAEANPDDDPGDKRRKSWPRIYAAVAQSVIEPVSVREEYSAGATCPGFILLLSRQWADRALIFSVFCLWPLDQLDTVLVYCHSQAN